ncbi:eukaryotic translation initiation factor 5-like [Schistocerca gregaria]|uniref:eukaryotic translation initiation factor 5-like n=1 Tax=Schistocerca gregaria TaxID=7010 RepID=UPI00211E9E9F|nr:eukaryotic translation initiation factor 5-like [Schistocerca gregaria]
MSLPPKVAGMVNIPRSVVDEFYRYKMPALKAKVEGRGNGVKTRIENMMEIAAALNRPPSYTTKFLGYELGTQTSIVPKRNTFLVNGRHDQEFLARLLDDFIDKFLLCKRCGNPETAMEVKNNQIDLRCLACGELSSVDMRHRLASYILKNLPPKLKQTQMQENKRIQQSEETGLDYDLDPSDTASALVDDEFEKKWELDTTPESVEIRRRQMLGNKESDSTPVDPIDDLTKFFSQVPLPNSAEIVAKVNSIASSNSWKDSSVIMAIFGIFFNENICNQIPEKAPILKLFVKTKLDQKCVLYCLECLCRNNVSVINKVSRILSLFYDEDILEEETIIKWYKNPAKKIDLALSKSIREKAKPFVDWLSTAEEEEEE